jgi:hypothetical protein
MKKKVLYIAYIIILILGYFLTDFSSSLFLLLFFTILLLGLSALSFTYLLRSFNTKWSKKFKEIANAISEMIYLSIPPFIFILYFMYNFEVNTEFIGDYNSIEYIAIRYLLLYTVLIYLKMYIYKHHLSGIKLAITLATISLIAYDIISFSSILSSQDIWFSTAFGIYIILSCFCGFLGLLIIISKFTYKLSIIEKRNISKMLFAINILWAYVAFTQYLIIFYGNFPKEMAFYEIRLNNGWEYLLLVVAVLHFLLPFLLLISKKAKENTTLMLSSSYMIFISFLIEIYWIIIPYYCQNVFIDLKSVLFLVVIFILVYSIFILSLNKDLTES